MPRDIPILRMPQISGGVLIKQAHLRRQRQSLDVLSAARRQASNMVKKAQDEAESVRRRAFSEGYEEGIIASAAIVARFLAQEQQMAAQLQQRINEHARRILSSALNHPEILLELMDEWLATLPATGEASVEPLELLIPEAARKSHARLKERIESVWRGKFTMAYHADNRFVMKFADQLAEFDADGFLGTGTRRLAFAEQLPDTCRRLSASGLRQLQELFSQFPALAREDKGELTYDDNN